MMNTVEIYADALQDDSVDREAERVEAQRALELAARCGLQAQAALLTPVMHPLAGQLQTQDQMLVWETWLPTGYDLNRYGNGEHSGRAWQPWKHYAYDRIPISVLELIDRERAKFGTPQGFDGLAIRTPEQVPVLRTDPALFGWKGPRWWLLARWGESDERLLSFEEIRVRATAVQQLREFTGGGEAAGMYVFLPLVLGGLVFLPWLLSQGHHWYWWPAPVTTVGLWASALAYWRVLVHRTKG